MNIRLIGFKAAITALSLLLIACQTQPQPIQPATQPLSPAAIQPTKPSSILPASDPPSSRAAANLLLGNPSGATADPKDKNNFLLIHPYYTLSYNNDNGEPNWVSWEVAREDLGTAPRRKTFAADTALPAGFIRIEHHDYTNSGFDRGHMCPHSDRAADRTMSYATFTMTNIIPQAPSLNQKAWNTLEDYLRNLAEKDNDHVYTICGPIGLGGWGSKGFQTTIAGGKVKVPAMCWKIAVIVAPGEGPDVSRITPETRVIAAIMPNDNSVSFSCAQYRTSVDQIEKATGLRFFTALPSAIAEALKKKIDDTPMPIAPAAPSESE